MRHALAIMLASLAANTHAFCGEIHDAAQKGDVERVKALLNENLELVSSKDQKDWTPLHYAVGFGHSDVAKLLLAHKADVNAKEKNGGIPLMFAAGNGQREMAEFLLAHGADVHGKDVGGNTPLHAAAGKRTKGRGEVIVGKRGGR